MGLLSFVKKIFGTPQSDAAPPDRLEQEIEEHGIDVSQSDDWVEEKEIVVAAQDDALTVVTLRDELASSDSAPEGETAGEAELNEPGPASEGAERTAPESLDNFPVVDDGKAGRASSGHEPES
jgi:hypothetical protein